MSHKEEDYQLENWPAAREFQSSIRPLTLLKASLTDIISGWHDYPHWLEYTADNSLLEQLKLSVAVLQKVKTKYTFPEKVQKWCFLEVAIFFSFILLLQKRIGAWLGTRISERIRK